MCHGPGEQRQRNSGDWEGRAAAELRNPAARARVSPCPEAPSEAGRELLVEASVLRWVGARAPNGASALRVLLEN